jgi:hypothetical protein
MREPVDDLEMELGHVPEGGRTPPAEAAPTTAAGAQQVRRAMKGKHVCPFCGTQRETDVGPCAHCSLEDTPTTRSATRGKLGPWYVLQSRNPSAPGMNFATLMVLVQKGRVSARSVLRGPTTGQFWRYAAKVKGVSREFGLCWSCGGEVAKNARACPACKRLQEPPLNPDVLLESAELSSEELAEAIWSDHTPHSSQMPGSLGAGPAPSLRNSPVERLTARGGVRREVAPQYGAPPVAPVEEFERLTPPARATESARAAEAARPQGYAPVREVNGGGGGSGAARPYRGPVGRAGATLGAGAHEAEMAVFQMPYRPGPQGAARRAVAKVFKSLFVAVLLAAAGVVAMCSFDDSFRRRVVELVDKSRAWVNRAGPTAAGTPSGAAIPAATQPVVAATGPAQAKAKAQELWQAGKEADDRGDFAAAVRAWEAIKALHLAEEDVPLGLDGRIAAAKKRIR